MTEARAGVGERIQLVPSEIPHQDLYFLLTSIVVPRPIGWISTVSPDGTFNVAPHSYFNAFSSNPPIVGFASTGIKDTLRNVRYTWDFVANVVTEELAEAMNMSATDFPPHESEFDWTGLTPTPSESVKAPRVGEARIAMECRTMHILEVSPTAPSYLVVGEIVRVHVDPGVMREGRVDPELLRPVGRLAGSGYSRTRDLFRLKRPTWKEVSRQPKPGS
ncbi:MAG: flavin reductase family protein [Chloroflexi bacterium]|nr:flavin reductase family protein [Chloroflexota bacterium]